MQSDSHGENRAIVKIGIAVPMFFYLSAAVVGIRPLYAGEAERVAAGARLAHEVNKGNCLACHAMPSDKSAITSATIGPALLSIATRFPDRAQLRLQIWDASQSNPDTVMPPFGRNKILSADDIELIVDYLYTL